MKGESLKKNDENHFKHISAYLLSCFNDGRFCDVVIKVSGDVFKAHKMVICAASNFFEAFVRMHGDDVDTIELQMEFKPCLFEKLLTFCYTGEINLRNDEDLLEVAEMADFLGMLDLLKSIQSDLSQYVTFQNLFQYMLFSDKYSLDLLWKDSCKIFSKFYEEILNDEEGKFYDLPLNIFKRFLNDNTLHILNDKNKHSKYTFDSLGSEKIILRSVLRYCETHILSFSENNEKKLLELFHFVKLSEFSEKYLSYKLRRYKNLANNDNVKKLFKNAIRYRFKEIDDVPPFWKKPRND